MKLGVLKNLVNSFKDLAVDTVKENVFPNLSTVAKDIKEGVRDLNVSETATGKAFGDMKDVFKTSAKSFTDWGKQLKTGKLYDRNASGFDNLFEDEEANEEFNDALKGFEGFDDGKGGKSDLDDVGSDDDSNIDYDKLGGVVESVAEEVVTDIAKSNRDNAGFIAGSVASGAAQTTNAIAKSAELNFSSLAALDKRLASMAEAQSKYYASSLELLGEIKQLAKSSAEMQAAENTDWDASKIEGIFEDGKFNVRAYAKELDKRFAENNPILSAVDEYKDLAKMMANPGGLMKFAGGQLLGKLPLVQFLKKMDENLSGLLEITLNSMANVSGSGKISDLLKFFGKRSSRTLQSVNSADYKRGKIDWDGESKKALTVVIPELLTDIKELIGADVTRKTGKSMGELLKNENRRQFNYATGKFVNKLEEKLKIESSEFVGVSSVVHIAEGVLSTYKTYQEATPLRKKEMTYEMARYIIDAVNKGFNFTIGTAHGDEYLVAASIVAGKSVSGGDSFASLAASLRMEVNTANRNSAKIRTADEIQFLQNAQTNDKFIAGRKIGSDYNEAERFIEEHRAELKAAKISVEDLKAKLKKLRDSKSLTKKDYAAEMKKYWADSNHKPEVAKLNKSLNKYQNGTMSGYHVESLKEAPEHSIDYIMKNSKNLKGVVVDNQFTGEDMDDPEVIDRAMRATGQTFWDTVGRVGDAAYDQVAKGVTTGFEAAKGDSYTVNYSVKAILEMDDAKWAEKAQDIVYGDPKKIPKGHGDDKPWQERWKKEIIRLRKNLKIQIDNGTYTKADLIHHISEMQGTEFFSTKPQEIRELMYIIINNWNGKVGLILRGKEHKDSRHNVAAANVAYTELLQSLPARARYTVGKVFNSYGIDKREFFRYCISLIEEFFTVFGNQGAAVHNRGTKRKRSLGDMASIVMAHTRRGIANAGRTLTRGQRDLAAQLDGRNESKIFTNTEADLTNYRTIKSKRARKGMAERQYTPLHPEVSAAAAAEPSVTGNDAFLSLASGGYTGPGAKYQPAGIVHKGEYVVPSDVMKTSKGSNLVNQLESLRLRGYDEGGEVDDDTDWYDKDYTFKKFRPDKDSAIAVIHRYVKRQVELGNISKARAREATNYLRRIATLKPSEIFNIIDPNNMDKPISLFSDWDENKLERQPVYTNFKQSYLTGKSLKDGKVPQMGLIYSYVGRQVRLGNIDELDKTVYIWALKQLVQADPEFLKKNGVYANHLNRYIDIEKITGKTLEDMEDIMSDQMEAKEAHVAAKRRKSWNPFKRLLQKGIDKGHDLELAAHDIKNDFLANKEGLKSALFGDSPDQKERYRYFIEQNMKGAVAGGGTGAVAGALFMGSPILGALMGGAGGAVAQNTKLRKFLFGARDEKSGKYEELGAVGTTIKGIIGGFFGKKAGDAFEKHGLSFMNDPVKFIIGDNKSTRGVMATMGLAGLAMGGVEGALVGSVAGRVLGRRGSLLDRFLVGKRHGDKYEGGLLHVLQGAFTAGIAGPMNTFFFGTPMKAYKDENGKMDYKKVRTEFYKNVAKMGIGLGAGGFIGHTLGSMVGMGGLGTALGAGIGGLIGTPMLAKKIGKVGLKAGALAGAGLGGYMLGKHVLIPGMDALSGLGINGLGIGLGASALGYGAYKLAKSGIGGKIGSAITTVAGKMGTLTMAAIRKFKSAAGFVAKLPWAGIKRFFIQFSGDPSLLKGQELIKAVMKDPNSTTGDKILAIMSGKFDQLLSFLNMEHVSKQAADEKRHKAAMKQQQENTEDSTDALSTIISLGGTGVGVAGLSKVLQKNKRTRAIGNFLQRFTKEGRAAAKAAKAADAASDVAKAAKGAEAAAATGKSLAALKSEKTAIEKSLSKLNKMKKTAKNSKKIAELKNKLANTEKLMKEAKSGVTAVAKDAAKAAGTGMTKAGLLSKIKSVKSLFAGVSIFGFLFNPIGGILTILKNLVKPLISKIFKNKKTLVKFFEKISKNKLVAKLPKVGKAITMAASFATFMTLMGDSTDTSGMNDAQKREVSRQKIIDFVKEFFKMLIDIALFGAISLVFPPIGTVISIIVEVLMMVMGLPGMSDTIFNFIDDKTRAFSWVAEHIADFILNAKDFFTGGADDPNSVKKTEKKAASTADATEKLLEETAKKSKSTPATGSIFEVDTGKMTPEERAEFNLRVEKKFEEITKDKKDVANHLAKYQYEARMAVIKEMQAQQQAGAQTAQSIAEAIERENKSPVAEAAQQAAAEAETRSPYEIAAEKIKKHEGAAGFKVYQNKNDVPTVGYGITAAAMKEGITDFYLKTKDGNIVRICTKADFERFRKGEYNGALLCNKDGDTSKEVQAEIALKLLQDKVQSYEATAKKSAKEAGLEYEKLTNTEKASLIDAAWTGKGISDITAMQISAKQKGFNPTKEDTIAKLQARYGQSSDKARFYNGWANRIHDNLDSLDADPLGQYNGMETALNEDEKKLIQEHMTGNTSSLEGIKPDLRKSLILAAKEFHEKYKKKLYISSGRRDHAKQADLFKGWFLQEAGVPGYEKYNLAAVPGGSNHEYGGAVDLDTAQANLLFGGSAGKLKSRNPAPGSIAAKYGLYRGAAKATNKAKKQGSPHDGWDEGWHVELKGMPAAMAPSKKRYNTVKGEWARVKNEINRELEPYGKEVDDTTFVNTGHGPITVVPRHIAPEGSLFQQVEASQQFNMSSANEASPTTSASTPSAAAGGSGTSTSAAPTSSSSSAPAPRSSSNAPAPQVSFDPVVAEGISQLNDTLSGNSALFPDEQLYRANFFSMGEPFFTPAF